VRSRRTFGRLDLRCGRQKGSSDEGREFYHVWSKAVNGEWLFHRVEKEVFMRMMWQVAEFTGIRIITFKILSNHFHIVLEVPKREELSDEELLRRYAVLHPRPSKYEQATLEVIKAELAENSERAIKWRKQQLALMYDLSQFAKLLKQRFTIWFNHTHHRTGPLWNDRFGSNWIEPGRSLQAMAAYVDLNCVRAGIVSDPKDYRFGGYAAAVAGDARIR
jgi:putative transposase